MNETHDDACRVRAVAALDLAGNPPEAELDALAAMAAQLLDCPIGLVTLIDREIQWITASSGTDLRQTPRSEAFCNHTIGSAAALTVEDATLDPRFADLPLVTGPASTRAYAGLAISARDPKTGRAVPVGAVCGLDTQARDFAPRHHDALAGLRTIAEALFAARTLRRQAEVQADQLRRRDRTFRQAEKLAQMGSWRLDIQDGSLAWSDGIYGIYDVPVGAPITLDLAMGCFPEQSRSLVAADLAAAVDNGTPFDRELDFVSANGVPRRVRSVGELELSSAGPSAVVGVFQDITAHHALQESLRRIASVDELTRIANRAAFNAELERWVAMARAEGTPLELVLVDIDLFKSINDRHGHLAGDDVLRAFGRRLRRVDACHAYAARIGGDEFALILRREAARQAPALIAALLGALKRPVHSAVGAIPVSGTIGHAAFDPSEDGLHAFIHRADSALYQAKRTMRGSARGWGRLRADDPPCPTPATTASAALIGIPRTVPIAV